MKYLLFDEYKKKNKENKKVNKRKVITISILFLIIITLIISVSFYITNEEFRVFFDKHILRKDINENNVPTIEINIENSSHIYAYDKYIILLDKNILKSYSSSAKNEFDIEVNINNPIFASSNRFLCLAENLGKKAYLISGSNIIWQKDLEGEITRINVNKNGYVCVVLSGTSYKNIVVIFDPEGKEMFKTYLSSTIAIDTDISSDNKYLAIAEIDTSGTLIQSNVKVISIEKAISEPTNAVIYIYPGTSNQIIRKIKYQDKDRLVCMFHDSVCVIANEQSSVLTELSDKKVTFADIGLDTNVVKVYENSSGLFADSEVMIINVASKKENIYNIKGVPRELYTYADTIAVNLGTEVHFISINGWLKKKYNSSQEIKNIVLSSNIAGIVYKNKIEVINL